MVRIGACWADFYSIFLPLNCFLYFLGFKHQFYYNMAEKIRLGKRYA